MGYKSLAQMPAHRNWPVSSNVRPSKSANLAPATHSPSFGIPAQQSLVAFRFPTAQIHPHLLRGKNCALRPCTPGASNVFAHHRHRPKIHARISCRAKSTRHTKCSDIASLPYVFAQKSLRNPFVAPQIARPCQAQTQTPLALQEAYPNLRHPRASESGLTTVQPDPLRRAVIWAK